jgi:DNA-directed RNA polymerase specialized sigma24 family protein
MSSTPTTAFHNMSQRQVICDYLADLPSLDRRVLFQVYAKKEGIGKIASDLQITSGHVQHILQRTEDFRRNVMSRPRLAA